MSITMY